MVKHHSVTKCLFSAANAVYIASGSRDKRSPASCSVPVYSCGQNFMLRRHTECYLPCAWERLTRMWRRVAVIMFCGSVVKVPVDLIAWVSILKTFVVLSY